MTNVLPFLRPDPAAKAFEGEHLAHKCRVFWCDTPGLRGWWWKPTERVERANGPYATSRMALLGAIARSVK